MKKTKPTTGIKLKVVTGFILLLSLALVAVLSIIKLATQLTPPDSGVSTSVTKLTVTSNLLSSLIEADGQARAFVSTGDPSYLTRYQLQVEKTRAFVDTLKISSLSNTNQYLRMLAVDSLLDLKRVMYNKYFELKQQDSVKESINFNEITEQYGDSIRLPDRTISRTITKLIPQEEAPKPGLIRKLWNNLVGKKKSDTIVKYVPETSVVYDTIMAYKAVRDTTLSLVKSQLARIEEQEKVSRQQAIEREMMLVQSDQDIMNEIRAVLLLYEKEEISRVINGTENSQSVLKRLWNTALGLAGIGLLTSLIFITMIWKDLAKSTFYRKQLEKARLLAETLLKVKEQFLANMSHEIRTPLTSIIGFTEMLSESSVNPEQAKYIKFINSSSVHLLELINDLLDFSKIDSGKLTFESRPFNPEELFEQAFETLKPRAEEKGLEMILKQSIPPMILAGDTLRIRQIVYNLLSNSIKFTEKGKIMLQTKATLSSNNELATLIIRVADTGIGIPKEKLDVIFDEFTQVDHSITRKYGGSGLGLAISKKLVEMMNGKISVLSRSEEGTIFTIKITLPIYDGNEVVEEIRRDEVSKLNLDNLRILLAEDDQTTRLLLAEFLNKHKAKVTEAGNGIKAWELYNKNPHDFDLIMTDIQMPGLSGPEFVEKILDKCRVENLESPVIIGLTAHADNNEIAKYKEQGMSYFLMKPFKNSELRQVLKSSGLKNKVTQSKLAVDSVDDGLDLSSFRKFAGDDEESLHRILASLSNNLSETANEMQKAYNENKLSELSLLAHRMLPNTRLLGASDVAASLKSLEIICKNPQVELSLVKQDLDLAIAGLNNLKERLGVKVD